MKVLVWVAALSTALLVTVVLIAIAPDESDRPPVVTRESKIDYRVGERVMARPYSDWLMGEVVAVTSEDSYIVKFCGNIGWFNKYECDQDSLLRSHLAKIEAQE